MIIFRNCASALLIAVLALINAVVCVAGAPTDAGMPATNAAATPVAIATGLNGPGPMMADPATGYLFFADNVAAGSLLTDSALKRVPIGGGVVQSLVDHTTAYDSGYLRGIGSLGVNSDQVIFSYGGYVNEFIKSTPKNPTGSATTLLVNSGGGLIGVDAVKNTILYSTGFCCIDDRSLTTGVVNQLVGGYFVRSTVFDANAAYFIAYGSNSLVRVDRNTGAVTTLMTSNPVEPDLFENDNALFVNIMGTVQRVTKDGSAITTLVSTGTARGVWADATYLYYVDSGNLYAKPVTGGPSITLASAVTVTSFAADSTFIYWDDNSVPGGGVIYRLRKPIIPTTCAPAYFVGIRGSGEPYTVENLGMGQTVSAVYAAALTQIPGLEAYGVPYDAIPALPITPYLNDVWPTVEIGRELATAFIRQKVTACPSTSFLIVGYSQGALVAGDLIEQIDPVIADRIIGVGLFGDPLFNPTSKADAGDFDKTLGGIQGQRAEFSKEFLKKTQSYCLAGDFICNATPTTLAHCTIRPDMCTHFEYPTYPLKHGTTAAYELGSWLGKRNLAK